MNVDNKMETSVYTKIIYFIHNLYLINLLQDYKMVRKNGNRDIIVSIIWYRIPKDEFRNFNGNFALIEAGDRLVLGWYATENAVAAITALPILPLKRPSTISALPAENSGRK